MCGSGGYGSLQDQALLLLLLSGKQRSTCGMLEDLSNAFVGFGRALEVFLCANLLTDVLGLWCGMSVHESLRRGVPILWVISGSDVPAQV